MTLWKVNREGRGGGKKGQNVTRGKNCTCSKITHSIHSRPRGVRTSVYMQDAGVPRNRRRKTRRTPSFGWTERQAGYECECVETRDLAASACSSLRTRSCMIHARVTRDPTTSRFEELRTCHTQQRHSVDSREQQGGTSIEYVHIRKSKRPPRRTVELASPTTAANTFSGHKQERCIEGSATTTRKARRLHTADTSANRREFWPWHMFHSCLAARLTVGVISCPVPDTRASFSMAPLEPNPNHDP